MSEIGEEKYVRNTMRVIPTVNNIFSQITSVELSSENIFRHPFSLLPSAKPHTVLHNRVTEKIREQK